MALVCINPPLVEPVTLAELKEMLRMDTGDTSQDAVLAGLNAAARGWCETICHRRFVRQTWRLLMDFFPGYIDLKLAGQKVSSPFVSGSNAVLVGIRYAIVLPYPPVQAIEAFAYLNANGTETDLVSTPGSFVQDLDSQPARLAPPFGQMWPVARVVPNAVRVDYRLGYASPVTVTASTSSTATASPAFTAAHVGRPLSIPGAGPNRGTLNTVIQSVDGSGNATLRDQPAADVSAIAALLVDYGNPAHWELVKLAIKFLVNSWYVKRMPSFDAATRDVIKALLSPATDLRF